jgi:hypothetical protein
VTLILFRVDATSNVHQLDFNKRILTLEMHSTNIKITCLKSEYIFSLCCPKVNALRAKKSELLDVRVHNTHSNCCDVKS